MTHTTGRPLLLYLGTRKTSASNVATIHYKAGQCAGPAGDNVSRRRDTTTPAASRLPTAFDRLLEPPDGPETAAGRLPAYAVPYQSQHNSARICFHLSLLSGLEFGVQTWMDEAVLCFRNSGCQALCQYRPSLLGSAVVVCVSTYKAGFSNSNKVKKSKGLCYSSASTNLPSDLWSFPLSRKARGPNFPFLLPFSSLLHQPEALRPEPSAYRASCCWSLYIYMEIKACRRMRWWEQGSPRGSRAVMVTSQMT